MCSIHYPFKFHNIYGRVRLINYEIEKHKASKLQLGQ